VALVGRKSSNSSPMNLPQMGNWRGEFGATLSLRRTCTFRHLLVLDGRWLRPIPAAWVFGVRRLSLSAFATTACVPRCSFSRTFRANWRSARHRRSRAWMPCSSELTTQTKNGRQCAESCPGCIGLGRPPSPRPDAVSAGSPPVRGHGISLMYRT